MLHGDQSTLSKLYLELSGSRHPNYGVILALVNTLLGAGKVDLFVQDTDGIFTNTASSQNGDIDETGPFDDKDTKTLRELLRESAPFPITVWPPESALAAHPVLRDSLVVPLADTFGILGFLLLRETDGLASDDDKTNLATLLSMILANAMSVEQMHSVLDRDFAIAQHVQKRLLPQINPVVAQVDYHVVFSAARMVTGDFYDYVSDDSLRLNFIIGDVSGKGLGAALLMANIVPGIRSVISGQEGIQETMVRLHEHVYEAAPQGSYATLFYGCLDLLQMQFKYVNAGHQPLPFVLHAGRDGRLQELASGGSVLGLFKRPIKPFRVGRLIVQPGDVIVCATDGATDAQGPDGDPFGEERFQKAAGDLRKLSSSALDIAQGLYSEVIAHMSGTRQGDDITIGVFCVH